MHSDSSLAHLGVVRSVSGGNAVVAVAVEGCSSCGHRHGCAIAQLASGRSETLVSIPAEGLDLTPGTAVVVEVPEASLLHAAVAGYLLPVLLALGGALAGHLAGGDAWAVCGAFAGLVSGILSARFVGPRKTLHLRSA